MFGDSDTRTFSPRVVVGGPRWEAPTTTGACPGRLHRVDDFLFVVAENLDLAFELAQDTAFGAFLFQGASSRVVFDEAWVKRRGAGMEARLVCPYEPGAAFGFSSFLAGSRSGILSPGPGGRKIA